MTQTLRLNSVDAKVLKRLKVAKKSMSAYLNDRGFDEQEVKSLLQQFAKRNK